LQPPTHQSSPYTTLFRSQGPKNLAAFLAYSKGLEALDRGDYRTAAAHFSAAVRADPSFQAAAQQQQAAEAAPAVQASPGDVVTVDRKSTRLNSSHLGISY